MAMGTQERSVSELFSDALNQLTRLIRNEIQLAKTEMSAKAAQAAMGIGFVVGGALISLAALVVLLLALAVFLIELGLADSLAHLIAAVVGLVISGALVWLGMNRLKPSNLAPDRTVEQLQRDAAAVREHVT